MLVSGLLVFVNAPLAPSIQGGVVYAVKPWRGVSESYVGNIRFLALLAGGHQTESHEEALLVKTSC